MNTVRPSSASWRANVRTHRMPSGSSPFTGSSSTSTDGSPSIAAAMPRRCPMPSEKRPARWPATESSPTSSSTSPTRVVGMPLLAASHRRWSRAERPGWTACASSSAPISRSGTGELRVAVAVDLHVAGRRGVEPEDHAHRGGLAGAVGAEEAGDAARLDGEVDAVDRDLGAESLGESPGADAERGTVCRRHASTLPRHRRPAHRGATLADP